MDNSSKVLFDWTDCIEGIKAGDSAAFETLYCKTYNSMQKRISFKMGFNEQDTEELLQELYIRVYQSIGSLNEPNAVITWMQTLCDRVCISAIDKEHRRKGIARVTLESDMVSDDDKDDFSFDMLQSGEKSIEEIIDEQENQRLLAEIIKDLKPIQCICIQMQMEGMSMDDIAAETGLNTNTVKTHIRRAKQAIKDKVLALEKQGTKLYGMAPVVFFGSLLGAFLTRCGGSVPANARQAASDIMSAAADAGSHSISTEAGAVAAVTVGVVTGSHDL